MRLSILCACAIAALAAVPSLAHGDDDESEHAAYCGINIPPDQAFGFVPLPEGDLFCPLIADPKAMYSYAAYVRGVSSSPFGTDLGSVGIADRFGIVRWGGRRAGDGVQLSLEGAVFAQFDLNTESYDLINADYLVGIPVTVRGGWLSARIRLYHQSSHLGDEFLERSRIPRENFAFESAEGVFSMDSGPLRIYAGGEYMFNGSPQNVATRLLHGGVELRQRLAHGPNGPAPNPRLIVGGDVKAIEDLDWEPAFSVRAGFEFGRESLHASRRWSLLAHYYNGPSPYGQFFRSDVEYYGAGLHFSL